MSHIFTEAEDNEWRKTLPRKIVNVKTIIKNANGEILLVKPSYRDYWHIPGGGVDAHESPLDAAMRELLEETSIRVEPPQNMTLVDVIHCADTDDLNIVYFADVTAADADVHIREGEIEKYKFVNPADLPEYLSKGMSTWWRDRGQSLVAKMLKKGE